LQNRTTFKYINDMKVYLGQRPSLATRRQQIPLLEICHTEFNV